MKTPDQVKTEIDALKLILADLTDQSLKDEVTAAMGELQRILNDSPEAISLSQIIIGAQSLVNE